MWGGSDRRILEFRIDEGAAAAAALHHEHACLAVTRLERSQQHVGRRDSGNGLDDRLVDLERTLQDDAAELFGLAGQRVLVRVLHQRPAAALLDENDRGAFADDDVAHAGGDLLEDRHLVLGAREHLAEAQQRIEAGTAGVVHDRHGRAVAGLAALEDEDRFAPPG